MRSRTAILIAALVVGGLAPPALAHHKPGHPQGPDLCNGPLACGDAAQPGYDLEQRIADNIRHGHVLEIDYRTPERTLGDVASGGAWGDSGLWTGVYLGGESYRYAVAKDKLGSNGKGKGHAYGQAALTDEERAFWTAQRDEAYARVRRFVDQYHLLVNIGKDWTTTLNPNPAGNPPSFGGGVLQGEEGLLMRACAPAPSETNLIGITPNGNKRIFGPFHWNNDGVDYYCETAPSRDTYAGTTFGLLLAFDLVSQDDQQMRDQIRSDMLKLATRLVKYGWTFPRPHGNVSHPAPKPVPGGGGHDFDNFISPAFMQQVPAARLNIAQSARHVATEGGTLAEQATWNAVWAEEQASQLPVLGLSMEVDAVQPSEGYFKYNLHHLTAFTTIRLEQNPAVRSALMQGISVMDKTTGDDGNAHFETITYGLTGEAARREDALTHLGEWLEYRHNIHAGPVNNEARCQQQGGPLECVLTDQLDIDLGSGQVVTVPGLPTVKDPTAPENDDDDPNNDKYINKAKALRARYPLPVALRAPTDFLWQRPPTQLNGSEGATHQGAGIDFLTPYWMLRYFTEVDEPALAPFPPWVGPAHR